MPRARPCRSSPWCALNGKVGWGWRLPRLPGGWWGRPGGVGRPLLRHPSQRPGWGQNHPAHPCPRWSAAWAVCGLVTVHAVSQPPHRGREGTVWRWAAAWAEQGDQIAGSGFPATPDPASLTSLLLSSQQFTLATGKRTCLPPRHLLLPGNRQTDQLVARLGCRRAWAREASPSVRPTRSPVKRDSAGVHKSSSVCGCMAGSCSKEMLPLQSGRGRADPSERAAGRFFPALLLGNLQEQCHPQSPPALQGPQVLSDPKCMCNR